MMEIILMIDIFYIVFMIKYNLKKTALLIVQPYNLILLLARFEKKEILIKHKFRNIFHLILK